MMLFVKQQMWLLDAVLKASEEAVLDTKEGIIEGAGAAYDAVCKAAKEA